MIYRVSHTTRYDYDAPVTVSHGELYQLPGDVDGQRCESRSIAATPMPNHYRERVDHFGNLAAVFSIDEPHTELVVTSTSVVDTDLRPEELPSQADRPWHSFHRDAAPNDDLLAVEFSLDSRLVRRSRELATYASASFHDDRSLADAVLDLNLRINADFVFDPEATRVDTPLEDVMRMRRGVCQDLAHVFIGSLRSIGLAACYVSGYLETDPPPGKPRLTGADRTHAWTGVYVGDGRWIGIDPTNAQLAGTRYITTAHGRDYSDVPPLKGVIFTDAEKSTLSVRVDVTAA